jgi:hypothetical protein
MLEWRGRADDWKNPMLNGAKQRRRNRMNGLRQREKKPPDRKASSSISTRDTSGSISIIGRKPFHAPYYAFQIYDNHMNAVLVTRSGQRVNLDTNAGRMFISMIEALVDQRGGPDNVTPAEIMLIKRAAMLEVDLSFQEADYLSRKRRGGMDPNLYTHMVDTQRKLLKDIGYKRRSRNITPGRHDRQRLIEGRAERVDSDDE